MLCSKVVYYTIKCICRHALSLTEWHSTVHLFLPACKGLGANSSPFLVHPSWVYPSVVTCSYFYLSMNRIQNSIIFRWIPGRVALLLPTTLGQKVQLQLYPKMVLFFDAWPTAGWSDSKEEWLQTGINQFTHRYIVELACSWSSLSKLGPPVKCFSGCAYTSKALLFVCLYQCLSLESCHLTPLLFSTRPGF